MDIYSEIKQNLEKCKTVEDYIAAYKWLAGEFVEVNESAKTFEARVKEMLPEKEFGALVYGSQAAYARHVRYTEIMNRAVTPQAKQLAMLSMLSENQGPEIEMPNIFKDEPEDMERD